MDRTHEDSLTERYRELSDDIAAAVAVISAKRGNALHAITVDSFLDVSYDPPTMAVSIYGGSRMMETLETSEHYAISLLNSSQRDISERLGASGQPLYGSLKGIDTFPAPHSGQPVLKNAIAWFELRTTEVLEVATHSLVVGEVVSLGAGANNSKDKPLLRWRKAYGSIGPR
ncbi:flavin reductase family protein [Brevibacterium sp. UCMA 11754]|uniref:flavin reductase family protein n=1 Tax=Brevibacterium sp. UCMA 11754 TaxID=2749198 RepID=UPI001F31269C|nr:flavin reductase family protein [Brevibacterium sp. UCMA 11754]MCF2571320.1 flavin reductase family protein [Brevibacterium sp. UCMA 11754]